MAQWTPDERKAHLARRLGLGITPADRARWADKTPEQVRDELLAFGTSERRRVDHRPFFFNNNGDPQTNPRQLTAWWLTQMAVTDRPADHKLLLFLHDHFAVSGEKVTFSPMMYEHLQAMSRGMRQPFSALLVTMTTDPAMMQWLDLQTSIKGRPNENFARELLELFSLGEGHYTEEDVQEAARALTGWGLRSIYGETPQEGRRALFEEWVTKRTPVIAASFSPALYDREPHKVLGKTEAFTVQSLCGHVADQAQTAQYLSKKLWEYYIYPDPSEGEISTLAGLFRAKNGRLTDVVKAIAELPAFWSDKARRAIVKSPVDHVVPIVRQSINPQRLFTQEVRDHGYDKGAAQPVRQLANSLFYLVSRQGMTPLFPPDVDGWKWGTGWISSNAMLERVNVATILTQGASTAAARLQQAARAKGSSTHAEFVRDLAELYDAPLPEDKAALLTEAADKAELSEWIGKPANQFGPRLRPVLQALFADPEFQRM